MGLAQVNRTIRNEFSPQIYHTIYKPKVSLISLPDYRKTFATGHIDSSFDPCDLIQSLKDLKSGASPIDIMPLIRLDMDKLPFELSHCTCERNGRSDGLAPVAARIAKDIVRMDDFRFPIVSTRDIKALSCSLDEGSVVVDIELYAQLNEYVELEGRQEFLDTLIEPLRRLSVSNVCVVSNSGDWLYEVILASWECLRRSWYRRGEDNRWKIIAGPYD